MKIAYVYDAVYPWEKGGAQKRVWELARRLADRHEVHLYGMHYWDGPRVVEREGVVMHGVCQPRELYVGGRRSIPQALAFAAALAPHLLREEFDVIDCQEFPYFPALVCRLHELVRGSTLVLTWYETWDDYWYEYLGPLGAVGKAIERVTAGLAGTVVPISVTIGTDLGKLDRNDGIAVVPNGVDYGGIRAIDAATDDWDVVYVGRLAEHKRVTDLLDAVARSSERLGRPVSCAIVGDGPERAVLEAHAEQLNITEQIEFLGFVESDADVIGTLRAASLFVLPSVREGFPNTILEAGACGVPAVVTNHPENGGRAIVEDGKTGFVVDPDADAIAGAVVRVLSDEQLRADLSERARAFAATHDWDRITERLEATYLDAVERGTA